MFFNPLNADADYMFLRFFSHIIKYEILNMLRIKLDINRHDCNSFYSHFVKSE